MLNRAIFKEVLIGTTLLAASGYTVMAQAHCIGINGNFGASGIATNSPSAFQSDIYVTVCPAGTNKLTGKIALKTGTSVSLEFGKGGYNHTNITDNAAAAGAICDAVAPNEFIPAASGPLSITQLVGGAGQYTMTVTKDTTTASNYAMEFHCMSADGLTEFDPESQSSLTTTLPLPNGLAADRLPEVDRIMNH